MRLNDVQDLSVKQEDTRTREEKIEAMELNVSNQPYRADGGLRVIAGKIVAEEFNNDEKMHLIS